LYAGESGYEYWFGEIVRVRIGIPQIFVFDPEARVVWEWSRRTANLERVETLAFGNGLTVATAEIWLEFDTRIPRDSAGLVIT
jgi:hypothetical protein